MLQTYDFLYKEAKIHTGVKSAPSINSAGQTARLKKNEIQCISITLHKTQLQMYERP